MKKFKIAHPLVDIENNNTGAIRSWSDRDSIFKITLLSTLKFKISMNLQHCKTGAKMWTKFVILYEQQTALLNQKTFSLTNLAITCSSSATP
jgi:hypothetical protein